MGGLLTLIGAAGFIGYLIWMVMCIRNWDSKIPSVIGMLLSVVMLSGGLMWGAETEPPRERNPASERSEPAETKADAPVEEDALVEEEAAIECLTHEIPQFGIVFDCPVAFGTEGESEVFAEDEVQYAIVGNGGVLLLSCSRISSLSRDEERYLLAGKDPTILYEEYESLDITDAITKYRDGLLTFDLLDSFSSPDSYSFYYIGTDDSEPYSEIGYKYKNYGSFVDEDGIIQISLLILEFEDMDREDFFTLCETVTNSIRFSE